VRSSFQKKAEETDDREKEADKRRFFEMTRATDLTPDDYPHLTFASGARKTVRCFPDKLPIGIEKTDTSRFVFLYLVNRRLPLDFRQFLLRHVELFRVLHEWTIRLLLPRRFRKAEALYKATVRQELWTPLNPSVSKALETYFRERREQGGHLADPSDRDIAQEFRKQGLPKIQALYRAWRRSGDPWAFSDHSHARHVFDGPAVREPRGGRADGRSAQRVLDWLSDWLSGGRRPKSHLRNRCFSSGKW
jgi:hypothetical protein